jgi:hypothetical protein
MYVDEAKRARGDPQRYVVPRDGELDVAFTGWEIGHGSIGWGSSKRAPPEAWTSFTHVRLYLTAGGKWVSQVEKIRPSWKESQAAIHDTPEEMFKWMTTEGYRPATKQAWEEARKTLPTLPALELEEIE